MTSQPDGSSLLISVEKSPENFDIQLGAVVKAMALVASNNSAGTATDEVCRLKGRLPCFLRSDWPRPVARRKWAWKWIGSIRK
ncbi:hypothetical protein TNCV_4097931 [Trichonephila clavipes]|nr:hypothetical protein TNCV_4097931 [Trichonephila clavipes]